MTNLLIYDDPVEDHLADIWETIERERREIQQERVAARRIEQILALVLLSVEGAEINYEALDYRGLTLDFTPGEETFFIKTIRNTVH